MNDDVVLKICLRGRESELNETDLGILDFGRTTSEVRSLLVNEDKAVNELGIIDSTAKLLGNIDIAEINIGIVLLINDTEDSINCHWGKEIRVLRYDFRAQRGNSILNELLTVVEVNRLSHTINDFKSLSKSNLETIRYSRRVNSLGKEILASLEESTSNNDNRCGTITSLNILSLRNLDEHLGGRMDYFHLLKDGGTIVGD